MGIGTLRSSDWLDRTVGHWGRYAAEQIYDTYGHVVKPKYKPLNKFGRAEMSSANVDYSLITLGSTLANNEVLTTSNSIDSIVSASTADTQTINIEGHRFDGSNNLEFVTTTATLSGTTPTTFAGMGRVTRMFIADGTFETPSVTNTGHIRCYDSAATTAVTAGVPQTPAALHASIRPGKNQTQKGQTAISYKDYYVITGINAAISRGSGSGVETAEVELQRKSLGGVWRPYGVEITLVSSGNQGVAYQPEPYFICPPNHDLRLTSIGSTADMVVTGSFNGFLLGVSTGDAS